MNTMSYQLPKKEKAKLQAAQLRAVTAVSKKVTKALANSQKQPASQTEK